MRFKHNFLILCILSSCHLYGNHSDSNQNSLIKVLQRLESLIPYRDIYDVHRVLLFVNELDILEDADLSSNIGIDKDYIYSLSDQIEQSYLELLQLMHNYKTIDKSQINTVDKGVLTNPGDLKHIKSDTLNFKHLLNDLTILVQSDYFHDFYKQSISNSKQDQFNKKKLKQIKSDLLERTYQLHIIGVAVSYLNVYKKLSKFQSDIRLSKLINLSNQRIGQFNLDEYLTCIRQYLMSAKTNHIGFKHAKYLHVKKIAGIEEEMKKNQENFDWVNEKLNTVITKHDDQIKRSQNILLVNMAAILLSPHMFLFKTQELQLLVNIALLCNFVMQLSEYFEYLKMDQMLNKLKQELFVNNYRVDQSLELILLLKTIRVELFDF